MTSTGIQLGFNKTAMKVKAGMSNYIPLFYVNVITYPYPNTHAALGNLC